MKTINNTDGVNINNGFVALMGKNIMVFCMNYIYAGKLSQVGVDDILLENASLVYETGELCAKSFKDAQKLPESLYIRINTIESYCISGR